MTQVTELNRSSLRTLMLHRRLEEHLDEQTLPSWTGRILKNLERIGSTVQGHPHVDNLVRWRRIVENGDIESLRVVLTSPEPENVEMREVSPMGGLLPQDERRSVLQSLPRR